MQETGLKRWLTGEDEPGDFYQLVGLARLCRDRDRLIHSFEEANEYLFHFQNHKDKKVRDRARVFHRQVAEARRIVSDAGRWEKYDQAIIDGLRKLCRQNPNFSSPSLKLDDLKRWLALVHQVDAERVDGLVPLLMAEPTGKKPPNETLTLSAETSDTEFLPKVSAGVGLNEREPAEVHFEQYDLDAEPTAVSPPKKTVPPPPSVIQRDPVGKSPPPPPLEFPSSPNVTIIPSFPAVPTPPLGAGAGSSVLWVVMAAFVTAMILGLFALAIAWASGAFEGTRPRAASSVPEKGIASMLDAGNTRRTDVRINTQVINEGNA